VSVITGMPILDNMYRMLDTRLAGTAWRELEPGVISPAIPTIPYPEFSVDSIQGLLTSLQNLIPILDNGIRGAVYSAPWDNPRGMKQQLEDILTALEAGGPLEDDQLAVLQAILEAIALAA